MAEAARSRPRFGLGCPFLVMVECRRARGQPRGGFIWSIAADMPSKPSTVCRATTRSPRRCAPTSTLSGTARAGLCAQLVIRRGPPSRRRRSPLAGVVERGHSKSIRPPTGSEESLCRRLCLHPGNRCHPGGRSGFWGPRLSRSRAPTRQFRKTDLSLLQVRRWRRDDCWP